MVFPAGCCCVASPRKGLCLPPQIARQRAGRNCTGWPDPASPRVPPAVTRALTHVGPGCSLRGWGDKHSPPQDSPWGAAQGGLPSRGRISCQGPKGLMGKGPACAKFGLSLHPQAKGSWTKAGGWAPWPPGHCPESLHMASPRGLFLFQLCSQCPSLHFLLPLCVMGISPQAISRPVYPQKERKKIKKPTALSWLNNEEQKAPQLSGTKGHSLHCRASQSRGLAKPQPWEPGLRSPQGPHRPSIPGGPQNVASSLWET